MSLLINIALALLPVPVVYLLYFRHYSYTPKFQDHMEAFLYGVLFASVLVFMGHLILELLPSRNVFVLGFFKAALVEKVGAYLLVFFALKRRGTRILVSEGIMVAMLLGIGFSVVENLYYAMGKSYGIILVRFLSAVPLHVTTCGMIGYYLSLSRLTISPFVRKSTLIKGFFIPYLIHGSFDTLLFKGGQISYFIGPMLVMMIVILEYMLARAQILPSLDSLNNLELKFEDWAAIQREPQYERWILRSMGTKISEYVPFIQWNRGFISTMVIVIFLIVAGLYVPFSNEVITFLKVRLRDTEGVVLFSILPAAYALNLTVVGLINPMYFRSSLIKIPIISDVTITQGEQKVEAITYDITYTGCFLKVVDDFKAGERIDLSFHCPGFRSPLVQGLVVWDNHDDDGKTSGTMVRLESPPSGYLRFLLRYYFFKLSRGLTFNLKLPGFQGIRRLFVTTTSVMQKTRKYNKDVILFEEGSRGKEFFLIQKGEVEVYKTLDSGEQVTMAYLGAGELFGEMALVGDQPRLASVRCVTECELAVAEGDNLDALIESNPEFTKKIIQVLSHRLHSSEMIMLRNISDLEKTLDNQEKMFHSALMLMLIATGKKPENNTITINTNLKFLRDYFYLRDETIQALFQYLMRYENMTEIDHHVMESYLTKEVLQAFTKYRLLIES